MEEYDEIILKKILSNNIKFDYISVEIKNLNTFNLFESNLNCNSYKLVDGHNVEYVYKNLKISTNSDKKKYSFLANSAGPFGNDIIGSWISPKNFFHLLAHKGLGWMDIHCSSIDRAEKNESYLKYIDIDNKIEEKVMLKLKSSSKKISKIKKIITNIFFKKKNKN